MNQLELQFGPAYVTVNFTEAGTNKNGSPKCWSWSVAAASAEREARTVCLRWAAEGVAVSYEVQL